MMPEKHVYEYAFVRYVPRVERGEFLNVGVIVFCKPVMYLRVTYQIDAQRLTAFAGGSDVSELTTYLEAWDLICQGRKEGGAIAQLDLASRFRWLTATRSTIIQSSAVHPGRCSDPDAVLNDLFTKYVL